ncbi:MAG: hypothetical protein A2X05_02405 [Bacteroidetes bacterium GWE2_41_25]|nr:MAG: hypothetical protein A2X03_10335 [Bacteroidetes bacterium GWA2_40_15]OFX95787.1 MAG: hypothetical protein A2X06_09385 [Bacteroidetes bacterium GWC2_40_22]OFY12579.1 MAG: hypothetical protein A2X05_02405 [Bacteroidetes bacterium GWE2_41_25]OFY57499.1 MAG: hypothetical protein A2X04_07225 [Bacteroidetes bacterium GWF2_41_9]HAM10048.1 nuclear pore complex subunit [Bacteroidales bacterium]
MLLCKKILPTKNTPELVLNPDGVIVIKGRSISGEVKGLPPQVDAWLEEYLSDPAESTIIEIRLEYIGGFSSGYYVEIVKKIKTVLLKGKKLIINWYYEEGDEDILEKGECFSIYLDLPFNFVMIKDPSLHKKL